MVHAYSGSSSDRQGGSKVQEHFLSATQWFLVWDIGDPISKNKNKHKSFLCGLVLDNVKLIERNIEAFSLFLG